MSEAIKVDIWSDVQCPWCYIGKRKFETGAEAFGGEVEVEYHSSSSHRIRRSTSTARRPTTSPSARG
jgi:predicted DsbA family dithiol-disulfide isomerase